MAGESNPNTLYRHSVFFINDSTGWAIGDSGTILKKTNGSISRINKENKNSITNKYEILQNYPNPFNPTTTIAYSLQKSEKVKIEVFNLLGQQVKTLLNKQMPSGSHKVEFTVKNLPSGVYLYRIKAGQYQEVKKMILLK